jgi:chromosome segregation protein
LSLEDKEKSLAVEIAQLKQATDSFVQLSLFEESFLRDKEGELEKLQQELRSLQQALDREKEALIEAANQIAQLRNQSLALEKRRGEIAADLTRNQGEYDADADALNALEQKRSDTESSLASVVEQGRQRALEAAELGVTIQQLTAAKEAQEHRVESLKERIQECRSRLVSLEDLQRNYEGYQEGVRAIMLKKQQQSVPDGIYGLVAEIIEAPEPYEKALTAVLGDRLQYVIVRGHEEGVEAIEYLKGKASGRGSFIPLNLSRRQSHPLPLDEDEVIAPLLEMISVKDGYRDVAEYLLSDVVVVKDLKAGLALWSRNGFYSTLVTPEGEVIDPLGIVTGGSETALEGSFLTQRRRIKELRAMVGELEARSRSEEEESRTSKAALAEAEVNRERVSAEIHRLELDRVRLEHESHATNQEFQRLGDTAQALLNEQKELADALERVEAEIRMCAQQAAARAQEKSRQDGSLEQKQLAIAELTSRLETAQSAVTQSRIRHAALGEKRENAHLTLKNRLDIQQEITEQIALRRKQFEGNLQRQREIAESLARAQHAVVLGNSNLRDAETKLQENRQNYKNISLQIAEIEEAVKELRPLLDKAQEEKNRLQLLLAEEKLRRQHLADNLREKYAVDLDALVLDAATVNVSVEDRLSEIEELRGRLERMGEVNLAAIGEFEELTTRFDFMSRQKEDLEKAIADLQQTIIKLNRICRIRFKESFDAINEKFESIFPRLFRGGKAKLVLTDENNVLETGVDIIAQPPGKKLQSITLLSGGEKALTAVSLLFAIFLTKPSPFCFLDEVDAPLDDANIDRFIELVKEMSLGSQFVLVTHNKKTMQSAEVLYGITMAEPGVSKVVSVRMN